jgi:hypothetical protein
MLHFWLHQVTDVYYVGTGKQKLYECYLVIDTP